MAARSSVLPSPVAPNFCTLNVPASAVRGCSLVERSSASSELESLDSAGTQPQSSASSAMRRAGCSRMDEPPIGCVLQQLRLLEIDARARWQALAGPSLVSP